MANKSNQAYKIAMVGLLAALSYVVFTYGQVKITLPYRSLLLFKSVSAAKRTFNKGYYIIYPMLLSTGVSCPFPDCTIPEPYDLHLMYTHIPDCRPP